MNSDGEVELIDDGWKAEPAKVSKVVAVKVSPSVFVFVSETNIFCHQMPQKMAGSPKHAAKNKPKPTPLFNDEGEDILFPEPSELLFQLTQKSIISPAKVMGRGDKVCAVGCIYASYPQCKSNIFQCLFNSFKLLSKHQNYSKIFFSIFSVFFY